MKKISIVRPGRGVVASSVLGSEGIVYNIEDGSTLASQIALNNKAEWDAIEGYQKLIGFLQSKGDQESIEQVKEIISDELNHAEVLRAMMSKYDGNIPTNES